MTLPLHAVLAHSAVQAAEPVVRAGAAGLDRAVRWVHSSEVLDIATLLRGGELLLTGGVVLGSVDAAAQRRYVRELAVRGVAGVAIETGQQLPEIPAELLSEAGEHAFPVIEFRQVVPFVTIAETINGVLVNESVHGIRTADAVSHQLSSALADGAGPQQLIGILADALDCHVVLLDAASTVLGEAGSGREISPQAVESSTAIAAPIIVRGLDVARLLVTPAHDADSSSLEPVLGRAVQIFGLAMALTGAVTPESLSQRELLWLLRGPDPPPDQVARIAKAAGVPDQVSAVGVTARGVRDLVELGAIDTVLRRRNRTVLKTITAGTLHALVVVPDRNGAASRARLVADLRSHQRWERALIGVGPVADHPTRFAHTLTEAHAAVEAASELAWSQPVVDSADVAAELLLRRCVTATGLRDFVEDQLGPLLALEPHRARQLVETLDVYFRTGCSKSRTARELHLQRQTLYQRLHHIAELLGGDATESARAASTNLSARLYLSGLLE